MTDTGGDVRPRCTYKLQKVLPRRTMCPVNVQGYRGGQQTEAGASSALVTTTPRPNSTSAGGCTCHTPGSTYIWSPLELSLQGSMLRVSSWLTRAGLGATQGDPDSKTWHLKWQGPLPLPRALRKKWRRFSLWQLLLSRSRSLEGTSCACQVHTALLSGVDQCWLRATVCQWPHQGLATHHTLHLTKSPVITSWGHYDWIQPLLPQCSHL